MRWSRLAALAFGLGLPSLEAGSALGNDEDSEAKPGWHLFPDTRIFQPLLADPRWPHFSLSYGRLMRRGFPKLRDSGTIGLGEHIVMVEHVSEEGDRFGIAVQAGVFGLFNLDASSRDLINADYRVAIPLDFRSGPFSAEASILHQSSHLGDEFILDMQDQPMSLGYEAFTATASLDLGEIRLYAGGDCIVHSVPADGLKPWSARQGIEWSSVDGRPFGPVAAIHVEERQESAWSVDLSIRAGVEFLDRDRPRRRFQVLLEYYRGRNPNGQFFRERLQTIGLGVHFYF